MSIANADWDDQHGHRRTPQQPFWKKNYTWPDGHRMVPYGSGDFSFICPEHGPSLAWVPQLRGLEVAMAKSAYCHACRRYINGPAVPTEYFPPDPPAAPKESTMQFEIFPRLTIKGRRWYFRAKARNGKVIAQSEGYVNRIDCLQTVHLLQQEARNAPIVSKS